MAFAESIYGYYAGVRSDSKKRDSIVVNRCQDNDFTL